MALAFDHFVCMCPFLGVDLVVRGCVGLCLSSVKGGVGWVG